MTRRTLGGVLCAGLILLAAVPLHAATPQDLKFSVDGIGSVSAPLQIVIVLTLLSFLPAVLVIMTSFTRIVIVFTSCGRRSARRKVEHGLVGLTLFRRCS